jgi:hypothetical protein
MNAFLEPQKKNGMNARLFRAGDYFVAAAPAPALPCCAGEGADCVLHEEGVPSPETK